MRLLCPLCLQVTALGMVSIFEQVLGGLPEGERNLVFDAFITALEEDPQQYRKGEGGGGTRTGRSTWRHSFVRLVQMLRRALNSYGRWAGTARAAVWQQQPALTSQHCTL
jgi:hypothetical protein